MSSETAQDDDYIELLVPRRSLQNLHEEKVEEEEEVERGSCIDVEVGGSDATIDIAHEDDCGEENDEGCEDSERIVINISGLRFETQVS